MGTSQHFAHSDWTSLILARITRHTRVASALALHLPAGFEPRHPIVAPAPTFSITPSAAFPILSLLCGSDSGLLARAALIPCLLRPTCVGSLAVENSLTEGLRGGHWLP